MPLPVALRRPRTHRSGRVAAFVLTVVLAFAALGEGGLGDATLALDSGASRSAAAQRSAPDPCALPAGADLATALTTALDSAPAGWLAGDLAHSVPLPGGRLLWLFGDTFFGERTPERAFAPGWRMDRNSALVQRGRCVSVAPRHGEAGWLPSGAGGHHLWPTDGFVRGDEVVVFAHDLVATGPGVLDFEPRGMAVAVFDARTLEFRDVRPVPYPDTSRTWGSSVVASGGWVYLFGWTHAGPHTYVARTRPADVALRWEFWDGRGWVADAPDRAAPIIEYGLWNNVHVSEHPGGGFVAVAKDHEMHEQDVLAWSAPRPEGPWGALGPLASAPAEVGGMTYQAVPHPAVDAGPGHVTVAYNVNAWDLGDVLDGSVRYGPRFVALPIAPASS